MSAGFVFGVAFAAGVAVFIVLAVAVCQLIARVEYWLYRRREQRLKRLAVALKRCAERGMC
jgi:hypothetical protein